MSTDSQMTWREMVERADNDDRHRDSLYPVVYVMSNGKVFRDSGPNSGVYNP